MSDDLHNEIARLYRENDDLRARLAEVEAALLQGGQTAQIRCNAALLALGDWTTKPPSAAAAGDRDLSPDRLHAYWPWGADDTCGVAVQDPATRTMRACRRPKSDPIHDAGGAAGDDRA